MSKPYKTRKEKMTIPVQKNMKIVYINARTSIEVSVDIPDDVAIERFCARHNIEPQPPEITEYPMRPEECLEESDVEEFVEVDDDPLLPELE